MRPQPDVLIVGGGVIGLTTAYNLARDGVRVTVVDRGKVGHEASWAGAGIVPPGNPSLATSPPDQLRAVSSCMMPGLSADLRSQTGIDNGYRRCGGVDWLDPTEVTETTALWASEGLRFSAIGESRGRKGYHLPDTAQVRNPRHLRALTAACGIFHVTFRPGNGVELIERDGGVTFSDGSTVTPGAVVVTAGAWTGRLLSGVFVRPVRGQIALLRLPEPPITHIVQEDKRYTVPRDDGRVLIGSTEEPEAGFAKRTTPEAIAGLRRWAEQWVPALRSAELEAAWAGLRPSSVDGLPYIGKVPGYQSVFVAAGHFRAGIQQSPATGRALADLLQGREPVIPLASFRPDRPPQAASKAAFRS